MRNMTDKITNKKTAAETLFNQHDWSSSIPKSQAQVAARWVFDFQVGPRQTRALIKTKNIKKKKSVP